ncbi:hypothetical protein FOPG_17985 [Fusarium oxysporum f. sp. conglutinans race 2 54008]|uniref:Uncharacterized protein n=1 Tax=Fusarium oxysporum f. sp. conglutinans race 2 54008 TaxID=1089457 RepID=X0GQE1_FUSOX|nr:hypothetical protein FOPG_17985 [Fusarium oxysporum f. sp. conglutinans race 2 54008]
MKFRNPRNQSDKFLWNFQLTCPTLEVFCRPHREDIQPRNPVLITLSQQSCIPTHSCNSELWS